MPRTKRPVPGLALAGTIEEVGPEVTDLRPDDEVFATADRSFAEFVTTDEIIDYRRESITGRYDVILDTACDRPLSQLRQHLVPKAR